ncbi:rab3 GTPase-activating protein non-catalytic subunit-like isoform X2 [Gigantopelta aegis]|uniref:rab3 GTPase-activating protein non-catalytic subunit-like isoform X2 n=1 Tax=Gigantopelta aegis TaxID=1735272 RepID=UPI001B889B21|nr:rab3 GTPase-activating protein non-catalytic subunit-like isoform X2 [Gigantopelta aegis]
MSCQLTVLSRFHDISTVKKFLFPFWRGNTPDKETESATFSKEEPDNWDVDWGWNEEETVVESEDSAGVVNSGNNGQHRWLQECIVSLSPTNDMVAFAQEDKICVLTQKWNPSHKGEDMDTQYSVAWQSSLSQEEGEIINCVMCLPLASQKRSTQGAPDWTCVIVGFSTGYIRMYTETGVLLLSQLLHMEPVQKLKCRTYESPRYLGMAEQHEELVILYRKAVVSIDGFSLIQSLRACRNQVARATASGSDTGLQPPPLAYKKWGLQGQDRINDHVSCGLHSTNAFDQLQMVSMTGGYNAQVKSSPPAATLYLTAGMGPYTGFYCAIEGSTQPILSEVALAMANKIKTALISAASGWLGFGGRQRDEVKDKFTPKIEPATPLSSRFGLPDQRRSGDSIALSPNNKYAALTDSYGRVVLIDVERGIAVRMWKGYRDAQLGWIQVREDDTQSGGNKDHSRVAQFLVIYAPRRGILEVWTAATGPRVAAFNTSKWCQLISPSHGMMGLNIVTSRGVKTKVFSCALIEPNGTIKTLEVPFHLALSDKSSKRARDLHLLRKLKSTLKENSEASGALETTIKDLILDMRIANIAQQAMERVLSTKYLSCGIMKNVLRACIQQINNRAEASVDIDSKLFLRFCQAQDSLLHTYCMIEKQSSGSSQSTESVESEAQMIAKVLGLTMSESEAVLSQVGTFTSVYEAQKPRVKFEEDKLGITSFLHSFSCHLHVSDTDTNRYGVISLHKGNSDDRNLALANFFFHNCLSNCSSSGDLSIVLQDSSLSPEQIVTLLLLYWLSSNNRNCSSLPHLHHILKTLTGMTDKSALIVDHSEISPWWQHIRDACSQSENILAAYLLAITCRSLAIEIHSNQTKAKDPDADTSSVESDKSDLSSEWETLAVDMENWNLLVKQLEDILALSTLFHLRLPANHSTTAGTAEEPIRVSVAKLLEGGRGSISEVVAQYITRMHLSPQSLYKNYPADSTDGESQPEVEVEKAEDDKNKHSLSPLERIQVQLDSLRERFPHSLENDVLLSNCCWECAALWNRDPENIHSLQLSLEFLVLVQNAVLRQGVCYMMWQMFIMKRMLAAVHLMEKVGKAPKERLCKKEVGMIDTAMTVFAQCVCDLLQTTMDANCEMNEVPVFNLEPIWQHIHGPASLGELAVDQKPVNYHLTRHHYHLAVIVHAILVFNMKSVKVLSLFDSKGKNSFFKDLHSHPLLPNQNVDTGISLSRRTFLCRVISHAVQTLESPDKEASSPDSPTHGGSLHPLSSHSKRQKNTAFKWPVMVLELAKDFGLDVDHLKRHNVCELYSIGQDKLAEEVLLTVNDHEIMGSQLLLIAGQRIAHYLFKCDTPDTVKIVSSMSTTLSTWLKQQDREQLHKPDVALGDTVLLLGHVANYLHEGHSEYNLAISLIELVQTLTTFKPDV